MKSGEESWLSWGSKFIYIFPPTLSTLLGASLFGLPLCAPLQPPVTITRIKLSSKQGSSQEGRTSMWTSGITTSKHLRPEEVVALLSTPPPSPSLLLPYFLGKDRAPPTQQAPETGMQSSGGEKGRERGRDSLARRYRVPTSPEIFSLSLSP